MVKENKEIQTKKLTQMETKKSRVHQREVSFLTEVLACLAWTAKG